MLTCGNQAILVLQAHVPQLTTALCQHQEGCSYNVATFRFPFENPLSKNKSRRDESRAIYHSQVKAKFCSVCFPFLEERVIETNFTHRCFLPPSHFAWCDHPKSQMCLLSDTEITYIHAPKIKEKEIRLGEQVTPHVPYVADKVGGE